MHNIEKRPSGSGVARLIDRLPLFAELIKKRELINLVSQIVIKALRDIEVGGFSDFCKYSKDSGGELRILNCRVVAEHEGQRFLLYMQFQIDKNEEDKSDFAAMTLEITDDIDYTQQEIGDRRQCRYFRHEYPVGSVCKRGINKHFIENDLSFSRKSKLLKNHWAYPSFYQDEQIAFLRSVLQSRLSQLGTQKRFEERIVSATIPVVWNKYFPNMIANYLKFGDIAPKIPRLS